MMFKNVVGQEQIKNILIRNAGNKRVSHAQLFLGAEGSGGLALALAYARFLQCRNPQANDACGTCHSCIQFNKYEHPDIHFYFPTIAKQSGQNKTDEKASSRIYLTQWRQMLLKSPYFSYLDWLAQMGIEKKQAHISVEDSNDIIKNLGPKAYEGPMKIVLIYMPERINFQAGPRLLKIMEEPPDQTLFLLVAANKELMLNTILSRTQILRIPPPTEDDITGELSSKYGVDHEKARKIAFLAEGDVAKAMNLVNQQDPQMAELESFREWMRFCFTGDAPKIIRWVETTARMGREKQKSFFLYGLKIFRLCLLQNYQAGNIIRLGEEEAGFIEKFAPFVNHKNIIPITETFQTAIEHLERNANPRILFTDLSFQLARLMSMAKKD